jgi:NAD(P)-dependent dehydrogenase (short-subunit alcohol dehydrogenase family)
MSRTVFILAASSDIGRALAARYADAGWDVIGTYRQTSGVESLRDRPNVTLLPCDVASTASIRAMLGVYARLERPWDVFISAVGVLSPIGAWARLDFDEWEQSVRVNSLAQLRVLHGLYPHRRGGAVVHAAFFAGGGTNNPFTNYSAYCLSKIALIKMCELIDDEVPDLNAFIVGPGFLPTKIHEQTFANPEAAGANLEKTQRFYAAADGGLTSDDLFDCINWCVRSGRDAVGGRNVAAVHDPWRRGGDELAATLRQDLNLFKLRRAGNAQARQGVMAR